MMFEDLLKRLDDFLRKKDEREKEIKQEQKSGFKQALRIIFDPYDYLINNFKASIFLMMCFVLAGVFLEFLFNQLYSLSSQFLWQIMLIAIFMAGFLVLSAVYVQRWYSVIFCSENIFNIKFDYKKIAKVAGIIFSYVMLCALSIFSAAYLYNREPNPNWVIELFVFTFFMLIIVMPILAIRYASLLAFAASGDKFPSYKESKEAIKEKGRSIFIAFLLILLLILFTSVKIMETNGFASIILKYFNIGFMLLLSMGEAQVQKEEFLKKK